MVFNGFLPDGGFAWGRGIDMTAGISGEEAFRKIEKQIYKLIPRRRRGK